MEKNGAAQKNRTMQIIKKLYGSGSNEENGNGILSVVSPKTTLIKIGKSGFLGKVKKIMPSKNVFLYAVLPVIVITHVVLIYYYNQYYKLYYNVVASESVIESLLEKRYHIEVNITKMLLDYSSHEEKILDNVVNSRPMGPKPELKEMKKELEKIVGEKTSKGTLLSKDEFAKLFALAEQYPDIKLHQMFQKFIDAVVQNEVDIAKARNDLIMANNSYTQALVVFPGFILNKLYGFEQKPFFRTTEDARQFKPVDF